MEFKNTQTGVTVSVSDTRAEEFRAALWEKVTKAKAAASKAKTAAAKKTEPAETAEQAAETAE